MESRKHYSVEEQEMVIGLYRESGKTLREFSESEGLAAKKLERWLREQKARREGVRKEAGFVEVEEKPEPRVRETAAKYRLGFGAGAWLEIEGDFERARVKKMGVRRHKSKNFRACPGPDLHGRPMSPPLP